MLPLSCTGFTAKLPSFSLTMLQYYCLFLGGGRFAPSGSGVNAVARVPLCGDVEKGLTPLKPFKKSESCILYASVSEFLQETIVVTPSTVPPYLGIDDLLALAELVLQPLRLEGGLGHGVVLEVEVAEGVEVGDGRLFVKRAKQVLCIL